MIIRNVWKYTTDFMFEKDDIYILDGRFVSEADYAEADVSYSATEEGMVIDGEGIYAIPGLVDIHFHGCVTADFCDGQVECLEKMAAYEGSIGVTTLCPASMTMSKEDLNKAATAAREFTKIQSEYGKEDSGKYARLVGINMEGPFISEAKKGAQAAEHIRKCDGEFYDGFNNASGGLVKLVDIAPEEDGAMEFIDAYKDQVRISIAHTTADYDTASEAFERGAKHVTHLYNAMPPFSHRAPGVIGAACDYADTVELICDGIHLHPSVVRTSFKMFGAERICLISDSMRATGMPDGDYSLGGQPVKKTGKWATLADGTIAGSATNLADCMRTAVLEMDIPLEDAIRCATYNPAKAIGVIDKYGTIEDGKVANLVLLNKDLGLEKVIING